MRLKICDDERIGVFSENALFFAFQLLGYRDFGLRGEVAAPAAAKITAAVSFRAVDVRAGKPRVYNGFDRAAAVSMHIVVIKRVIVLVIVGVNEVHCSILYMLVEKADKSVQKLLVLLVVVVEAVAPLVESGIELVNYTAIAFPFPTTAAASRT